MFLMRFHNFDTTRLASGIARHLIVGFLKGNDLLKRCM
jgi:hypothetical protein